MPPHETDNTFTLNGDGLAYTTTNITPDDLRNTIYTTTTGNNATTAWMDDLIYRPYTWTTETTENTTDDIAPRVRYEIDLKLDEFQKKLDRYLHRIHDILKEHCFIGISEDEFMRLIKEE